MNTALNLFSFVTLVVPTPLAKCKCRRLLLCVKFRRGLKLLVLPTEHAHHTVGAGRLYFEVKRVVE